MNVDGINSGYVLDHIKAGTALEIYRYLHLERYECCVAVIMNVRSNRMGKKDIIKIDAEVDLDLDILGFLDDSITVNVIKDGALIEKKKLTLPEKLVNVIHCKNPRCITSTEQEIDHVFCLIDKNKREYRCAYCETRDRREIEL